MPDPRPDVPGRSEHPAPEHGSETRRFTFPRSHRLKRQRLIRSLFDRRRDDVHTVAVGCIRLLYRIVPRSATGHDVPLQIGFAPGRKTRSGVPRIRVRRVMREAYRLSQHVLTEVFAGRPSTLVVMALFRGDPDQAAALVPRDLPEAMRRCAARCRALPDLGPDA